MIYFECFLKFLSHNFVCYVTNLGGSGSESMIAIISLLEPDGDLGIVVLRFPQNCLPQLLHKKFWALFTLNPLLLPLCLDNEGKQHLPLFEYNRRLAFLSVINHRTF